MRWPYVVSLVKWKLLVALLVLLILEGFGSIPNAHAVQEDKAEHAALSAVATAFLTVALKDTAHPYAYAAGIVLGLGVVKEIYDSRPGGTGFSGGDIAADAVGTSVGLGIGWLIIRPNFIGVQTKW